ncbi:MAG: OmpA family protein, partial [Alphaproteobacteria bacterium]|nr:OmpA family protein [Alphaproteobacteria bacterium]
SFKTDGLFNTSEYRLRPESTTAITKALSDVQKTAEQNKIDLKTETDYCLMVVGKTDRVPFKNNTSNNQILSEQRAEAIATELRGTFNPANIRTYGIAEKDCTNPPHKKNNDPECRRVDVLFLPGTCSENITITAEWVRELAPNAASTLSSLISATKAQ